jgi:transglutaminase-like putative cysteine protease
VKVRDFFACLKAQGIGENEVGWCLTPATPAKKSVKVSDTTSVTSVSAKVARLCVVVYEALEYVPATTNINTIADQALVLGRGV